MMVTSVGRFHSLSPLLMMVMVAPFAVTSGTASGLSASSPWSRGATATMRMMVIVKRMVMMMLLLLLLLLRPSFRDAGMIALGSRVGDFGYADVFVHTDGRTEWI